jgi:hypothetical protein
MGGGAFILLKSGPAGPETAKQTEIHLANLLKILQITRFFCGPSPRQSLKGHAMVVFAAISGDMANCPGSAPLCYLDHSF